MDYGKLKSQQRFCKQFGKLIELRKLQLVSFIGKKDFGKLRGSVW